MVITGSPLCDRQLPRRGVACPGHVHDMSGTCPIGSCPGEAWERKGAACKRLQRGGECAHSRRAGDATGLTLPFPPSLPHLAQQATRRQPDMHLAAPPDGRGARGLCSSRHSSRCSSK